MGRENFVQKTLRLSFHLFLPFFMRQPFAGSQTHMLGAHVLSTVVCSRALQLSKYLNSPPAIFGHQTTFGLHSGCLLLRRSQKKGGVILHKCAKEQVNYMLSVRYRPPECHPNKPSNIFFLNLAIVFHTKRKHPALTLPISECQRTDCNCQIELIHHRPLKQRQYGKLLVFSMNVSREIPASLSFLFFHN